MFSDQRYYYLHNFSRALGWIGERYGDLLDEAEQRFLAQFAQLPQLSQVLMVRMLMRRGPWFRTSKLLYEEIPSAADAAAPLLELGWIDRGVGARRAPVASLASVAADVLDYHEAALAEAGLTAKVVGDAQGAFDVPLLRRALSNLLGNATRYARTGSLVQIHFKTTDDDRVEIRVTNCGECIAAEIFPHLFDRFFRADPARSHAQSNHGLGLAIVGAIARMHQGKPVAWSESGVTSVGLEIRAH